ncbi:MAG: CDP-alcohol phosphatidyltransferase family protein [Actinomycetes bacterium]
MSTPSVAELRAVVHPPGLLDRRSGEHWAGRLYMRRISLHVTRVFLRLGWSPNQVTWLMIVTGVLAGPALLVPGLAGAVLGALLIQLYLLLDCSDGEVARWTGRTSITGVYLDRVGHYLAEASLLVGVGFRAADVVPNGWAVLGLVAALGAILIKAETDLVDVARVRAGLTAATESSTEPRSTRVGQMRRVASALRFHRILGAVEASLLVLLAAVVDAVAGGLTATRVLVVALAVVAGLQLVLHLASILLSRRLAA